MSGEDADKGALKGVAGCVSRGEGRELRSAEGRRHSVGIFRASVACFSARRSARLCSFVAFAEAPEPLVAPLLLVRVDLRSVLLAFGVGCRKIGFLGPGLEVFAFAEADVDAPAETAVALDPGPYVHVILTPLPFSGPSDGAEVIEEAKNPE